MQSTGTESEPPPNQCYTGYTTLKLISKIDHFLLLSIPPRKKYSKLVEFNFLFSKTISSYLLIFSRLISKWKA